MSEETKSFDEMNNSTSHDSATPVTDGNINANSVTENDAKTSANPEEAKNQELYSRGVQLMQEKKFDQAIKCFDKIPQYKDSKQKSEEAKKIKEETRRATSYDNAIKAFNTGHYDTAIVLFSSLKDYKDSKAKLAICNEKREIARKDAIYDDLMRRVAVESITIAELEKCINEFKTISGHKDADAQVKKLNALVEEKKEQEAIARAKAKKKNKIIAIVSSSVSAALILAAVFFIVILPSIRYNKAEKLMAEGRYDEALKIYESLDGRDNSDQRIAVIEAISSLENNPAASVREIVSAGVTVNATYNLDSGKRTDTYYSYDNFKNFYTPTKSGYTFDRWELESYTYTVGNWFEVVLNPVFVANTYTVTLENTRNEGTNSAPTYVYFEGSTAYMKVTYGSSYTLPTLDRDEYVLTGWSKDKEGKDKVESATWNIPYSLRLYPAWEGKEFTVTLDPNGGTVSSTSVNVNYDSTYTLPTPVWAGHTFSGWYYNNSQRVSPSGTWRNKSDMTLVASWDTDVYSISYNLDGGANSGSNPAEYTVYDEFTLEAPTKVGYTFVGWTYDGQSTPVMELTVSVGTTGNKTYTANWTADTYTVTLDLNGGTMSGSTAITVTYDGSYSLPSNVTKVGYTFAGWSKGSSPFDSEGVWQISDDDVTLTARWTPNTNTPYTVEHYLQNSNGEGYTLHATDRFTGTTGASVLTYVNTYPHYVSPTAETVIIAADGSTVLRYYYDVATYYIVYATGGGDAIENQAFRYGQTPTADALPTRAGYTFGGWFIDAELTTPFALTSAPEGNVTAYAWWTEEAKPSDFTYSGTDEITITDYSGTATVVIVPPYIGTVPVTEIADSVFADNTTITKVIIPDTVTEMGDGVFAGCTSLTELVLPSVFSTVSNVNLYTTSSSNWILGANGTARSNNKSNNSTSTYTITATANMTLVLQYRVSSESGCDKLSIQKNGTNLFTPISGETSSTTITVSLAAGESVVCRYSKDGSVNRGDDCAYVNIISAEGQAVGNMGRLFGTTSIEGTTAATQNYTTYYVPTSLRKVTVTSGDIDDYAFAGFSMLEEVQLENVEAIGNYAFLGCSSLKRVNSTTDGVFVIPDSVTSIGQNAFANCNALETMTVPFIGSGSDSDYGFSFIFGNVPQSLTEIIIATDTTIPQSAFYNLQYVESITLPSGVTSISDNAFNSCVSLTDIEIPDTVRSIGNSAFSGCISLEEIDIPDSVTSIGSNSFYGCISLTSIELPESLTSIGSYAFSGCTSLEAVELPEFLTSIEDYAFSGCTGIKKINSDTDGELRLPEELETIGSYAFQNLTQITSVVVPDSVTSIGYYAFSGCNAVEAITVPFVGASADATSQFHYIFSTVPSTLKNITVTTDTTIPDSAFYNLSHVESITIPSDVISIGSSAFYGCSSLEEIEIPDTVTSIVEYAFYGCTSLTTIELPESLTSIGSNVFSGCTALERINSDTTGELILPESLETIGSYAFQGLTQITKVVIPDSVTSIGSYAFSGCTGIKKINSDTDGELRLPEKLETIGAYAFQNLSQITSVVVLDSVTGIGSSAFYGCNAIESITVPFIGTSATSPSYFYYIFGSSYSAVPSTLKNITITGGTSIPNNAFYNLSNVESITIPTKVTSIGSYAFYGCSSLEEIEIPDSVTSIGSSAFYGCTSLTTIELPESLTSIGDYVFYGCTGIKKINSDTDGEFRLPEGLETIGSYAFQNLSQITSVVVPDSVTSIGQYAFSGCSTLESITVPFIGTSATSPSYFYYIFGDSSYVPGTLKNITITTATTIPDRAFQSLSKVESITIPSGVTTIGSYAFDGCTNLKRINSTTDGEMILSDGLVTIGSYAFQNLSQITKVVVPDSVTNISEYAFRGCNAIKDITLPFVGNSASAEDSRYAVFGYIFGRYASSASSNPTGTIYQGWGQYSSSYPTSGTSGRNSYYSNYYADYYYIPTSIKKVTITVDTTIPYGAFHNCSFIETITIPITASSGDNAYLNCGDVTVNATYVPTLSVWGGTTDISISLIGSGTEEDPYRINSAADLAYLASSVNGGESYAGKYFVLNVNVNLNNYSWTPIGTAATPFTGIFDGNGKKITGVYINTSSSTYLGLFGNVSGTVKDLGIASGTITLTSSSANSYVGGLVGYLSGTVENCYSNATVSGRATQSVYVGGLVGYVNTGATVNNSYATGNATSTSTSSVFVYAGGLAGYNKGTIAGSLAFGNVTATGCGDVQSRNGGLVGRNDDGTITDCYRSEDQVLTKHYTTDKAYCTDGTEASYSDMMEYAEENWDSDVWSFDLKYPTHK